MHQISRAYKKEVSPGVRDGKEDPSRMPANRLTRACASFKQVSVQTQCTDTEEHNRSFHGTQNDRWRLLEVPRSHLVIKTQDGLLTEFRSGIFLEVYRPRSQGTAPSPAQHYSPFAPY